MGLKEDIYELKQRSEREYSDYKYCFAEKRQEYENCRGKFDSIIATINAERLRFREEIRVLYDFLQSIGGSLKYEKRISVFEFLEEAPAPNQLYVEIDGVKSPDFKNIEGWDKFWKWFYTGVPGLLIDNRKNKKMYEEFLFEVEKNKNGYVKDINDRINQINHLNDAIKLAQIYRNIVVIVKDTVKEKIIPELELIQAFLYADTIRERILDEDELENIELGNIVEYKGTRQDIHYQFVRNTFDFYKISTAFFRKTILTDILSDRIVTEEEKNEFYEQIEIIKGQMYSLESKRVMKNE